MSKRFPFFLLVIATILVGMTAFWVTRETQWVKRKNLENNISRMISLYKSKETSFIDFSSVASFAWDRLYIFGPYTPSKVINKSLDTIWFENGNTSIEHNEGIVLLVFTNEGKVVQYLEFPRGPECDFSGAHNLEGYERGDAHFGIDDKQRCVPLEQ